MHHHRTLHGARLRLVAEVEADGQLEVELDRGGLMHTVHGVHHLDIDLRTVERAVAGVHLPVASADEVIQTLLQRGLGSVPQREITHGLLGTGGQFQLEGHPEDAVDVAHEIEHARHLLLDLVRPAEDVRVVLLEAAHARQTVQRARQLIAVQHAKVGEAQGQLYESNRQETVTSVAVERMLEHEAVTGAVHGLQTVLRVVALEQEHVVLVVIGVPADAP